MSPLFLSAEWRKIIFINYSVPPEILKPYIPLKTELDLYKGECLVSLAGFQFLNTCISGIPLPFHKRFQEFNLRFYVVYKTGDTWRRGVMFISEFVPKPFFKHLANMLMREKYTSMPMKCEFKKDGDYLNALYAFNCKKRWNGITAVAGLTPKPIEPGTLDEFIAEHYWGYNTWYNDHTIEYRLNHPRWASYELQSFNVDIRFEDVYPLSFAPYLYASPHSAQFVEGSAVKLSASQLISVK